MYKILKASKDTYITDRVISRARSYTSNVGAAGSLDLFKLYESTYTISGSTKIPNHELSRLLVKFDMSSLVTQVSSGKVDPTDTSFKCFLKLFDVYGGQPTPNNFVVAVYPLSQSFDEGIGNDVVYYGDKDTCNFVTASWNSTSGVKLWYMSGANSGGIAGTSSIDYVNSSSYGSLKAAQTFVNGAEDLYVDVTNSVKSILNSEIPDEGFRVSFDTSYEDSNRSYFVKRFVARNAYNKTKHPQLVVLYDDSFQSDQESLTVDSSGSIHLHNSVRGVLTDISSGSFSLTGSNCLKLKLSTEISGGWADYTFLGSKYSTGVYTTSVFFGSTDTVVTNKMNQSGSVVFKQLWTSLDNSIAFLSGANVTLHPADRGNDPLENSKYVVTTSGLLSEHSNTDIVKLRVYVNDVQTQFVRLVRSPIETYGVILRDVHYSVRDYMTNEIIVPFDKTYNSTRLSSDTKGMYTSVDMSNFVPGRTYVIDVMVSHNGVDQVHRTASPVFRITETV
jgi:hypothetical protein